MLKQIKQKKKKNTQPTAVAFVSETINLPRIVLTEGNLESDEDFLPSETIIPEFESKLEESDDDVITSSEDDRYNWNQIRQSSAKAMNNKAELVRLNVGGVLYCTSLTTLTSKGGMLSAMFSGRYSPYQDDDGSYFIDRDGKHFRYILNYMRDGFVRLPEDLQTLQELMVESQYYQLPGLIKAICEAPRLSKKEYITIRYLPANTYDGWPIRIEGPLEEHIICELNGGSMPPTRETTEVRNMYGQSSNGWKVRGIFLTKIFNIIASYGWRLTTSNGSGGGKQRNFAEMYVFCRSKLLRRQRGKGKNKGKAQRRSANYSFSHLFSFLNDSSFDEDDTYSPEPAFAKEHPAYSPSSPKEQKIRLTEEEL